MDRKLEIRLKLRNLYLNDQNVRKSNNSTLQKSLDTNNFKIIENLVKEVGYISNEKYGKITCKRARVLVQHGRKENLEFMKHYLELINNNLNEFNKPHYAYLLDKISFLENKPQKFGTQFVLTNEGVLSFDPIKDKTNLEKIRSEYNLRPFEEYVEYVKKRLGLK